MNLRRLVFALVLLFTVSIVPVWALGGEAKAEFDAFVKNIRESRRADRVGYLVLVQTPPSKSNDARIFSLAGKYAYASDEGYLTHVNYIRLQRMQSLKLPLKIIDKKRLDDASEQWYLVWCRDAADDRGLRAKFEPLYAKNHTRVIRIRPGDEEDLQVLQLHYSLIDETLLPLRQVPTSARPAAPARIPDPIIAGLLERITVASVTADVQALQDCVSRAVREKGNSKAIAWLAEQFGAIPGLTVTTPAFSYNSVPDLKNVVAIKRGDKEPGTAIVVGGHCDSTVSSYGPKPNAPGADDNGSGAAAVLNIARAVADLKLHYTVIFCQFNAEEVGLIGSKAFARTLVNGSEYKVKAMLNMDMIADKDRPNVAVIGNTASNWLIDVFKDNALAYTGLGSNCQYNSDIWQSDHSSFWNIGIPAILTIEGYPDYCVNYHSIRDTVANMSPTFMTKVTKANLATLLALNPIVPQE